MLDRPFETMKRKEIQALCASGLFLLDSAITFKNRNGYIFVIRKKNKKLFALLDALQFFDFQRTNKKRKLVAVHQIVLWFHRGVYAWRYHKDKVKAGNRVECHHYNSVTSENNIENLTYVTAQQNSLCANAVHKDYYGLRTLNSANIKNWYEYGGGPLDTANLIRKTLVSTFIGMGFTITQIPSVAYILLQLPFNVGVDVVKHWSLVM